MSEDEVALLRHLRALSDRISQIADAEAKFALVGGPARQGALYREKMRLVREVDELLDRIEDLNTREG